MVTIERRRGPFRDLLSFYPDASEVRSISEGLGQLAVASVRQASALPASLPNVVSQRMFPTTCVDLTASEDEILKQMRPTTRNLVNRGLREQSSFDVVRNCDRGSEDFLRLNRQAAGNIGAPSVSPRRLPDYLRVSDLFVAYHEGEALVAHVIVRDEKVGRARLAYSASSRFTSERHDRLAAVCNRYLHFHEFQLYKQEGFSLYDFGGIGTGTAPIAKFKLSFGGFRLEEHDCVLAAPPSMMAYRLRDAARAFRRRLRQRVAA